MSKPSLSQQDRRRKRALIVFQFVIYGYLASMFLFQLYLWSKSDW